LVIENPINDQVNRTMTIGSHIFVVVVGGL
jgi:hypothetical protein